MPEPQILMRKEVATLADELAAHAFGRSPELGVSVMDLAAIFDGLRTRCHHIVNANMIARAQKQEREGIQVPNMRIRGKLPGDNGKLGRG